MNTEQFNKSILLDINLLIREKELEKEAVRLTQRLIGKRLSKRGILGTREEKRSLKSCQELMVTCIKTYLQEQERLHRKSRVYKYMQLFNPEYLALAVSRQLIGTLKKSEAGLTVTADSIGKALYDMYNYSQYQESDREGAKRLQTRLDKISKSSTRELILREELTAADFVGEEWQKEDVVSIGYFLVRMFCDATGLFTITTLYVNNKKKLIITPSMDIKAFMEKVKQEESLLMPYHYPMLIPPLHWTTMYNGGYIDKNFHRLSLMKTHRQELISSLELVDMERVQKALNDIQATPLKINDKILPIMEYFIDSGETCPGIVDNKEIQLPAKPWGDLSTEAFRLYEKENTETVKAWKKKASNVYKKRARKISKSWVLTQQIELAKKFKDEKAIYFPHVVDFRGREYPVAGAGSLNPQAQDVGKSLLQFAIGKPLGESGGYWLCVHLTNCWGNDKISLDDRVLAAMVNAEDYKAYAKDPIKNQGWMKASKPWQFLAACFEFVEFLRKGDNFVSYLPIAVDGTCSGLQHFAAMLRDTQTAKSVNVCQVKNKPSDIYQIVADDVKQRLEAEPELKVRNEWLSRLSRSIVKTNVMTTPYGVTRAGMKDQLCDKIEKLIEKGTIEPFTVSIKEAAEYLLPRVIQSMADKIPAAVACMDWLKDVARIVSKTNQPITWLTPSGFQVNQSCLQNKSKRIEISYRGQRVSITVGTQTKEISSRKQVTSIAPNFVHSMDAAHLINTVNKCTENDVDSFYMVHDAFATHACDTDKMAQALREEFIAIYSKDVLYDFYNQICDQLPDVYAAKITLPPTLGDLDINAVLESNYFFA